MGAKAVNSLLGFNVGPLIWANTMTILIFYFDH